MICFRCCAVVRKPKEKQMKFELRRIRTGSKSGEQGSTIVLAKGIAVIGAKPDQTQLKVEASITISAAQKRGSAGDPIPGTELGALRLLMENAVKAVREHEASQAAAR